MKTMKTFAPLILLFAIGCSKAPLTGPSSVNAQTVDKSIAPDATYFIGEHFGGGIIYYVDQTGQHGLIADTVDLGTYTWYNDTASTTGATKTDVGKGRQNTNRIVSVQGKHADYAALKCFRHRGSGYTDWFLPSKDELYLLWLQKDAVGGFAAAHYWSSSEYEKYDAWNQSFATGIVDWFTKEYTYHVRAIRAF